MAAQSNIYSLPTEHVSKSSNLKLKFNNRKKLPCHRLPFVGKADDNRIGLSWWNVPKAGGYSGGNQTGQSLAYIYMQYLRANPENTGGILQHIVLDMFDAGESRGTPEMNALRGQVVGFCYLLERWLVGSAVHLGSRLDSIDEKTLLEAANNGLNFDNDAYLKSLSDDKE